MNGTPEKPIGTAKERDHIWVAVEKGRTVRKPLETYSFLHSKGGVRCPGGKEKANHNSEFLIKGRECKKALGGESSKRGGTALKGIEGYVGDQCIKEREEKKKRLDLGGSRGERGFLECGVLGLLPLESPTWASRGKSVERGQKVLKED